MSDVPVVMLVNIVLTESAEYRDYEKGFPPLLERGVAQRMSAAS